MRTFVCADRDPCPHPPQLLLADDVTEVVLPLATHWRAEEHPVVLLAVLEPFLAGG